jgi:hypothetical protein
MLLELYFHHALRKLYFHHALRKCIAKHHDHNLCNITPLTNTTLFQSVVRYVRYNLIGWIVCQICSNFSSLRPMNAISELLWSLLLVVRFMMLNFTFNNISVKSWWSVLLVEETGVTGENHLPVVSHWQTLSHNVVSSKPCHEWPLLINLQSSKWCSH